MTRRLRRGCLRREPFSGWRRRWRRRLTLHLGGLLFDIDTDRFALRGGDILPAFIGWTGCAGIDAVPAGGQTGKDELTALVDLGVKLSRAKHRIVTGRDHIN